MEYFEINNNNNNKEILLKEINNITNISYMIDNYSSLSSLPYISKWKYITIIK